VKQLGLIELINEGYAADFNKKHPRPPDSGTVILISRDMPYSWLDHDDWKPVLSPKSYTLEKWRKSKQTEKDWKEHRDKFNLHMKAPEAVAAVYALSERVKNGETITLLCYCKPGEHCHRYIVKDLIDSLL
jgi:uncharacterized protein YeaO (DUF488 family)